MAWPEIESFHNIRKYTSPAAHPEILNGNTIVDYRPKVKLHGTNAAVQVHEDGSIVCQSRESIITREKDNAGFAKWAHSQPNWDLAKGHILYGEWCGPGIQKGVAIAQIPRKVFAIFAARPLDGSDKLIVEPDELRVLIENTKFNIPDVYVLPWYNEGLEVDWSETSEELTKDVNLINEWVSAVEANDPWVEATFNVKGTGEGLVFYPRSDEHLGFTNFNNLVFKAKGEKHKNIATAKPAQVDATAAASIDAFVAMVLTEARLEQGATKVSADGALTYDMKNTGKFVSWVSADVEKETQDELAASNLTFKQVQKAISDKARAWYLAKAKEL